MTKETKSRPFVKLVSYLPHKHLLAGAILFALLLAGLQLFQAYVMSEMVDTAIALDLGGLFTWSGVVLATILLDMAFLFFRTRLSGRYSEEALAKLREDATEHLTYLPVAALEKSHSGDYISRLSNDLARLRTFTAETLVSAVFGPVMAVMAFIYLSYLNWQLTLIVTIGVPLIFILSSKISAPMGKYSKERQESLAQVNAVAQEAISGVEVSKAFNLQPLLLKRFSQALADTVKSSFGHSKWASIMEGVGVIAGLSPYMLCFGLGGIWVLRGDITAGSIIAYIMLLEHLTFPIGEMPRLMGEVRSDMAAADRIFEILDTPRERRTGLANARDGQTAVSFTGVTFAYEGRDQKVLDGVSFTVDKGETVALVGPSGGGKSTVIKQVLGFYEPSAGQVEVLGEATSTWDLDALRRHMAFVSQDAYLFPGTVRENIALGRPEATEQEIQGAAKAAYAHEFISSWPEGYETRVGELGSRLSGGQRQRLTLARAILRNAPILLLDEATSALDTESESLVQAALDRFMVGRTTLVVAHRLSTIRRADRIIVLDQGRVIEEGRHEELIEQSGLYKELYRRQFSAQDTMGLNEEAV